MVKNFHAKKIFFDLNNFSKEAPKKLNSHEKLKQLMLMFSNKFPTYLAHPFFHNLDSNIKKHGFRNVP
jgi:hypothetical protein